jgi:protein SEY1
LLINHERLKILTEKFRRETDRIFLDAKRSMLQTTAKIPPWLIVALIVLGWNEFMALLSSPLYLLIALTVGTLAYVVYVLNLGRPLIEFGKIVANEASKRFQSKMSGVIMQVPSSLHQHRK